MSAEPMRDCHLNPACHCEVRSDCSRCGWNPEVEKQRKEKMAMKAIMDDLNSPADYFIISGCNIKNGVPETKMYSIRFSKSGNLCIKCGEETMVLPTGLLKEAMNGR